MKTSKIIIFGATLLIGLAAWAQEYPLAEAGFDYSYARYAPSGAYTSGHSLNGGGGSFVYDLSQYFGIKADFQGYGSNFTHFNIPAGVANFPGGFSGNVQGNLFTYLFGPQIKVRTPKVQPFVHFLFGGAHSNLYGNAFKTICQPVAGGCKFSKPPGEMLLHLHLAGVQISRLASMYRSGQPKSIICSRTLTTNLTTAFSTISAIQRESTSIWAPDITDRTPPT